MSALVSPQFWSPQAVDRFFQAPDNRVPLNFRVKESLKSRIQLLMGMWKIRAKAQGKDTGDVDMTFTCERLLEVAVAGAIAETLKLADLTDLPKNEAEWDALSDAIKKQAEESASILKKIEEAAQQ